MIASADFCHAALPFPDPHMLAIHIRPMKQSVSICSTLNVTRYSVGDPIHTLSLSLSLSHTHTHTHAHAHRRTHMRTSSDTHTHTHTHTHKHTHHHLSLSLHT